jgi:hypothetical protein
MWAASLVRSGGALHVQDAADDVQCLVDVLSDFQHVHEGIVE